MLVRLTSSTSGKMVMLAEHAREIFRWMNKECVARGVFTLEQLPEAIARLRLGIEEDKREAKRRAEKEERRNEKKDDETPGDDKEKQSDETITLAQRAQPLLRLMEQTLKESGYILWEAPERF